MHHKICILSSNLHKWNKCTFGNIFKEKEAIQHELEIMQHSIMDTGYIVEVKNKENDLLLCLNQRCEHEEFFWQHKSRVDWLTEGEINTTFFHHSTLQYRIRNMIIRLKTEDNSILEEHADLEKELLGFYKNMLTEPDENKGESI